MKSLFAQKEKRYRNLLLVLLPLFIIAGLLAYFGFTFASETFSFNGNTKPSNLIEQYGYELRDNATDLQKELFDELKNDLTDEEVERSKIAGDIVKNFVADYFTWTNKQGSFDVGGMCYITGYHKNNFWMDAVDGFYKYVTRYINEYGANNLLEVESIEILNAYEDPSGYVIGEGGGYKRYNVEAKWTYKPSAYLSTSNFADKLYFTLSEDTTGGFAIVEIYED